MPRALVSKKEKQARKGRNGRKKLSDRQPPVRGLDKLLSQIYYTPKNPASFSSPYKLFKAAQKNDSRLQLKDVTAWIEKQPAYTLNREVRLKFKKRKVVVSGIRIQYQGDLVEYQPIARDNDGFRYLLTVIDCFSRLATAVPIKRKGKVNIVPALKVAFEALGGPPQKFQTDDGKEFYNGMVKEYLDSIKVRHFSSYNFIKAQIVERFNRTLKTKIQYFMIANNTLRYIDVLPEILKGYNNSVHRTLKEYTPSQVSFSNEGDVFEKQYRTYLDSKKKRAKFKIGETVRISTYRGPFFKKSTSKNFTTVLFTIVNVLDTNPVTYQVVEAEDAEAIEGTFYEQELQRVGSD